MPVRRGHWRSQPLQNMRGRTTIQSGGIEEATEIDQARTPKELMLKEAIHIRLNCPSLNRDGGLELPGCRMAALRKAILQLPVTPLDVASGDNA